MTPRTLRQIVLCNIAAVPTIALLTAGFAHAQGGKFTQRERIALAMDNSPEIAIAALETVLTQEQIVAFEAALLPSPSDAQKKEALGDVMLRLLQAGFSKDDPLVAAVDARADEIAVDAPAEPARE